MVTPAGGKNDRRKRLGKGIGCPRTRQSISERRGNEGRVSVAQQRLPALVAGVPQEKGFRWLPQRPQAGAPTRSARSGDSPWDRISCTGSAGNACCQGRYEGIVRALRVNSKSVPRIVGGDRTGCVICPPPAHQTDRRGKIQRCVGRGRTPEAAATGGQRSNAGPRTYLRRVGAPSGQ